jgi:hypothetical protein
VADLRQPSSGPDASTRGRSSAILSGFGKFPQCERSEPLFPNEVVLQFEVNWKIEEEHKIEEVVKIEEVDENCSKLQNCGGGFGSIFGRNFGSVFGVHF